jgi:hypothetical protein
VSAPAPERLVVALDPGTDKCGLAAVTRSGQVVRLAVVHRAGVVPAVVELLADGGSRGEGGLEALLVGDGTGSRALLDELASAHLAVTPEVVSERLSTLKARYLYFALNPPRGLQRLIPRGLLIPPRPVDDYAALVLAHEWLAAHPR